MKLAYVAYDKTGRQVADSMDAPSVAEATETLRSRGFYVTKIQGESQAAPNPAWRRMRSRGRGQMRNLAMFMRQLHVLVSSGTPMVQALGALERQTKEGYWRNVVSGVRSQVEQGSSLSTAMEGHKEVFDAVCRSVVAAGESSGNLPEMLDRLAVTTRKQLHMRSAVIGAVIYPCLLLVITTTVLTVLLLFVIPRFGMMFKNFGVALPPTTKVLITLGQALQSYWWLAIVLLVATLAGLRFSLSTPAGQKAWDTMVLRLPQAGRIARSFITARIARLLGVLLEGRVPVLEALDLARESAGNYLYIALMQKAHDGVARGEPFSWALKDTDLISPAVYEAVRNGEQSGQVGPLLTNIADFLDEENEIVVKSLTSILEPVILVIMGLLVGFVAISMFMPLFDLTSMTGGGAG